MAEPVKPEYCVLCFSPTGRAGTADDSIFVGGPNMRLGPLCQECLDAIQKWAQDDIGYAALLAERDKLKAEIESKNRLLPSLIAEGKRIETERAEKAEAELQQARVRAGKLEKENERLRKSLIWALDSVRDRHYQEMCADPICTTCALIEEAEQALAAPEPPNTLSQFEDITGLLKEPEPGKETP